MDGKTAPQIFLSYAPEDKEIVDELYQKLLTAGFKPWMDSKDILPGEAWQAKIRDAIENSDFFLACLSNNSVSKRGNVQKEFKIAQDICQEKLDTDIYIIPVHLDECPTPENMEHLQQLNLFEKNGFARLELAIRKGAQQYANIEVTEPIPVSQSRTEIKYLPQYPKSAPKSFFVKRAIFIGVGALIATIGIPWLYNHYIYRVPQPVLPLTCQASVQPVRVGVGQLTNCPETFQKQLIDHWKSGLASPTPIPQAISSSAEAQEQAGFDVVVWGKCEQADNEVVQLNFDLTTSRKPFNTFEPQTFQVTDNLALLSTTGQALWHYQHGDYNEAARLFGELTKNQSSADLGLFEANSLLFAEQYEDAIRKFQEILPSSGSNQAGAYNNLSIALQNTKQKTLENPNQSIEQLNQAIKIAGESRQTDLELLAHVNRSFLYSQRNSWENARGDCDAALSLNAQSALPHICLAIYYFSLNNKPSQLGLLPLNEINQQLTEAENMKDAPPLINYIRAEWHLDQYFAEKQKAVDAYERYFAGMQYLACLQLDKTTLDNASRKIGQITTK